MEEERKLVEKYGLKNKRELWKAQSTLRGFRRQARDLQARLRAGEPQARRETDALMGRLTRHAILPAGATTLDDVLALSIEDVLKRRLEWVVWTKGLSPTVWGARQLIVHGHLSVGGHRVTRPGFVVPTDAEGTIGYTPTSPLQNEDHPIRMALRERQAPRPEEPISPAPAGPGGG
jgi:small subunit ribosomal protein S4